MWFKKSVQEKWLLKCEVGDWWNFNSMYNLRFYNVFVCNIILMKADGLCATCNGINEWDFLGITKPL